MQRWEASLAPHKLALERWYRSHSQHNHVWSKSPSEDFYVRIYISQKMYDNIPLVQLLGTASVPQDVGRERGWEWSTCWHPSLVFCYRCSVTGPRGHALNQPTRIWPAWIWDVISRIIYHHRGSLWVTQQFVTKVKMPHKLWFVWHFGILLCYVCDITFCYVH